MLRSRESHILGHFRSKSDQRGLLCGVARHVSSQLTRLSVASGGKNVGTPTRDPGDIILIIIKNPLNPQSMGFARGDAMASKFGSWWQKMQRHPVTAIVIIGAGLLGVVLLVALIGGYSSNWDWTGFGSYTSPTKEGNFQRAKTLWDWMELLLVPIMAS